MARSQSRFSLLRSSSKVSQRPSVTLLDIQIYVYCPDIEPNQNYEVTVTIRNITKNMRRIMFTQPTTSKFHCEYENTGAVAAGLSVKMNMQFETNEEGDFHDMIQIHTEGYNTPYKLHLHALRPAPDIQFEPLVNLKFIPTG